MPHCNAAVRVAPATGALPCRPPQAVRVAVVVHGRLRRGERRRERDGGGPGGRLARVRLIVRALLVQLLPRGVRPGGRGVPSAGQRSGGRRRLLQRAAPARDLQRCAAAFQGRVKRAALPAPALQRARLPALPAQRLLCTCWAITARRSPPRLLSFQAKWLAGELDTVCAMLIQHMHAHISSERMHARSWCAPEAGRAAGGCSGGSCEARCASNAAGCACRGAVPQASTAAASLGSTQRWPSIAAPSSHFPCAGSGEGAAASCRNTCMRTLLASE